MDHYSDYHGPDRLPSFQASSVVQATKQHFWRHGLTNTLITDSGGHLYPRHSRHLKRIIIFITVPSSQYWSQPVTRWTYILPYPTSLWSYSSYWSPTATSEPVTPPQDFTPTRGTNGTKSQRTTFSKRALNVISSITWRANCVCSENSHLATAGTFFSTEKSPEIK